MAFVQKMPLMLHLSQSCISLGVLMFQVLLVTALELITCELLRIMVHMDLLHVASFRQAWKGELLGISHFCDSFLGLLDAVTDM